MLTSMTGFGRSSREVPGGRIVVEIQSVNRRHLEISLSLPEELSRYELRLRKRIGEALSRGQIAVRCTFRPSEEALSGILPDPEFLSRYRKAWVRLAKASGFSESDITLPLLLERLPKSPSEGDEALALSLEECLDEALAGLLAMKRREGEALSKDLSGRISALRELVDAIAGKSSHAVAKTRDKLKERMAEFLQPGSELDERLLREIALFAEKIDISEEILRFRSHLAQFAEILHGEKGAAGRKLEFLLQELGREINTVGSKSADAAVSQLVVEGKAELEKLREQIQNVE